TLSCREAHVERHFTTRPLAADTAGVPAVRLHLPRRNGGTGAVAAATRMVGNTAHRYAATPIVPSLGATAPRRLTRHDTDQASRLNVGRTADALRSPFTAGLVLARVARCGRGNPRGTL